MSKPSKPSKPKTAAGTASNAQQTRPAQQGTASSAKKIDRYRVLSPYDYKQGGELRSGWTEVGVGFPNRDGKGMSVELRPGLSVSGRLVLRLVEPDAEKDGERAHGDDDGIPRFVHPSYRSQEELV